MFMEYIYGIQLEKFTNINCIVFDWRDWEKEPTIYHTQGNHYTTDVAPPLTKLRADMRIRCTKLI
jgi:hypothetical protein